MTPRGTILIISLCLGSALLLLGMLAGFVPHSEGPEVRRRASDHVISLQPEDLPEPIVSQGDGTRLWAIRRTGLRLRMRCSNPRRRAAQARRLTGIR